MIETIRGIIPPMTTPFTALGDIDVPALRAQVRFLVDQGVHGLAVGGSTGEGHTLDRDDLRRAVAAAVEESAGRVPVIAGIIVDSTRDAGERGRVVRDLGVTAIQVTPVHYLFRPYIVYRSRDESSGRGGASSPWSPGRPAAAGSSKDTSTGGRLGRRRR